MINIKPAIDGIFRSNALDFEDNTFVGLQHDNLRLTVNGIAYQYCMKIICIS